jgi:hypothetical protein
VSSLQSFLFDRHLEDDEEVQLLVHKHWLVGFKFLFLPAFSFVLGWLVLYLVPFRAVFFIVAIWSVIAIVWLLRNFFDYYLDAWIITDAGIIDVEWHGWFHRESTRVLYSDVQGVSYEIQGVAATLLRFGEISVEKISTGNAISLDYVSRPRSVEGIIMRSMEEYLHGKNLKDAKHVQELLSEIVARESQLEECEDEDDEEYEEYEDDDE